MHRTTNTLAQNNDALRSMRAQGTHAENKHAPNKQYSNAKQSCTKQTALLRKTSRTQTQSKHAQNNKNGGPDLTARPSLDRGTKSSAAAISSKGATLAAAKTDWTGSQTIILPKRRIRIWGRKWLKLKQLRNRNSNGMHTQELKPNMHNANRNMNATRN